MQILLKAVLLLFVFSVISLVSIQADTDFGDENENVTLPWFFWVGLLFITTLFIGFLAVLGGIGGGVLYVPILTGFFPFHMDFVRCAGLVVALTGALSATPHLIRKGYVSFRLAFPAALIASISSILGATAGLYLPANVVQIALGITILGITALIAIAKKSEYPRVSGNDRLAKLLAIHGTYHEHAADRNISWQVHRTLPGFLSFTFIGFVAGMFGLGAGWANVPVLNLLMGAPLKMSVATSQIILSVSGTSAAWIYISRGALLPLIVLPSVAGMMIGSRVGSLIMPRVKPRVIRYIVVLLLLAAGVQSVLKGIKG